MTEIGRFFTLFGTECLSCGRPAASFGYCKEHYQEQVALRYASLVQEGRDRPMPDCFASQAEWEEYQVFAIHSLESQQGGTDACKDCTPEFHLAMKAEGRCTQREVVFVRRPSGDVEGINARQFDRWRRACAGEMGVVVRQADSTERRKAVVAHYRETHHDAE